MGQDVEIFLAASIFAELLTFTVVTEDSIMADEAAACLN